jgi:phosphoserine phosphatase
VKNTLVLLSNPARPTLDSGIVQSAVEILRAGGATVATPDWLAPDVACDIPFEGRALPSLGMSGIDAVFVATAGRRKQLLIADMESTMIDNEMLDELADFLGLREKISAITARAMNGEIDFAGALKERVGLLKGLPLAKLDEAAKRIRYMPGGATLVATMKQHGAYCALVSGGFTHFTKLVAGTLGFDFDSANVLTQAGQALAGTVEMPILGKEAKLATLRHLSASRSIATADAVAVGDGANDLPMLEEAGLGVAFHAKPAVAAQVGARLDHCDLTGLLYLQGYRQSEFVKRKDP